MLCVVRSAVARGACWLKSEKLNVNNAPPLVQIAIWDLATDVAGTRQASSQASRSVRKAKQKNRFKYVRVPPRMFNQSEGDFPIQVRPNIKAPQLRDLQDPSLDEEASLGYERSPKVKPHHVREALLRAKSGSGLSGSGETLGPEGLHQDKAQASWLKEQRRQASEVQKLDIEKDLPEEDAAALAAMKARALAKRNYKWMPNPFSAAPGPLGVQPGAEAKYYDRYFDGQEGQDGRGPGPKNAADAENYKELGRAKPVRERISASRF